MTCPSEIVMAIFFTNYKAYAFNKKEKCSKYMKKYNIVYQSQIYFCMFEGDLFGSDISLLINAS